MSEPQPPPPGRAELDPAEKSAALFAQLVMQQANLALMLLGKTPHPESGETIKDTEAASLFIDQLEMLEVKTKGNLSKEEANLLKQALMNVRLAFVSAVETAPASAGAAPLPASPTETAPAPEKPAAATAPAAAAEDEHRKKFSKKY